MKEAFTMKTIITNKKKFTITGLIFLISLLIISAFVWFILFGHINDGPSPFIIPIDENTVIQQVYEDLSLFDDSDYVKMKFICDDLSLQNRGVSDWATNKPCDDSIQFIKDLDGKVLTAMPRPLVILSDLKSSESDEIELQLYEGADNQRYVIVNMTDEIRKDHMKEAINLMLEIYGICYIYDNIDPHIYLSKEKTPIYYDSPMYLNYIEKIYDNLYLYIYYTTRNPIYE